MGVALFLTGDRVVLADGSKRVDSQALCLHAFHVAC